jgi:hypothetical protein
MLRQSIRPLLPALLLLAVGCTALVRIGPNHDIHAYEGDGDIWLISRHYGPGLETHGYSVGLPPFRPTEDLCKEYSLADLPRWQRKAHVEIVTFIPEKRLPLEEIARMMPPLSPEHSLSCTVIDRATGAVVAKREARLVDLENSCTYHFGRSPPVRHILSFDLQSVPSTKELALRLSFQVGGAPVDWEMAVVVVVDAPTA